jgi:hypothetical protein
MFGCSIPANTKLLDSSKYQASVLISWGIEGQILRFNSKTSKHGGRDWLPDEPNLARPPDPGSWEPGFSDARGA